MTDDDLDLDLEPERPSVTPRAKPTTREEAKPPAGAPKVMAERKPGVLSRVGSSVSGQLSLISRPNWSFRNFLIVLAVLVALVVLAENWAAVRVSFLGLRLELPKALAFLLNIILGGALMWFWLRRGVPSREE